MLYDGIMYNVVDDVQVSMGLKVHASFAEALK